MQKILHNFAKRIPDGAIKESLRSSFLQITNIPIGTEEVKIGPSNDKITALLSKLPLRRLRLGEREIDGYLAHYSPKSGDIVVNAGAYHGIFAIYLSKKVGSSGKVICFEPDANNRKILQRNIKLNKASNITVVPKGLWFENDTLSFSTRGSSSRIVSDSFQNKKIEVCSLDKTLNSLEISKINFISMDIEGAEIEAVKGITETVRNNPDISIAIASYHHVNDARTAERIESALESMNLTAKTAFPRHLTTYGQASL